MGLRFSKRVKILPGVTLNFSKRGVSASAGPRGAKLTVGRRVRTTFGIPGTGISHTTVHGRDSSNNIPGIIVTAIILLALAYITL